MYHCIKCNVTTEKTQKAIDRNGEKEGMKKREKYDNLTWAIFSYLCVLWNGAPLRLQWKILQWLFSTAFLTKTTLLHRGLTKVHWALPTQQIPKIRFIEQLPLNTHTHSGLLFVFWGQDMKVCYISVGHFNTTASSVQHLWGPEPVALLFILQKGAPKIWGIEEEAHTYILYSSNFFQSSEIHLALVTIWPLP